MRRFGSGETAVWRSVWQADRVVGTVRPCTIVADLDDLIALFLRPATVGKRRSGDFGGPRGRMLLRWDGGYEDLVWHSVNVLILYRPGDMHSVWRAWDAASGELRWRYVNLEERWRRTAIGFDSRDLYLDLWAKPGSNEWRWKDEDEAAWAVENGRMTGEQLAAARADGELAIQRIRRGEPPHDRDWDSWRPDPAWTIPVLPSDWREYDPRRVERESPV
jgi:hypothetical protein